MWKGIKRLRRELGSWPREIVVTLLVALVVTVIGPVVISITLDHGVPVWAAVLAGGSGICVGIVFGASGERQVDPDDTEDKLKELEQKTATLGAYDTYAVHVRDALADVRRELAGELPNFSLREFIETGIFEPAHVLLQQDHTGALRGDVRFSILHPSQDGSEVFLMAENGELFPAHGHRAESRERFRLPIKGSFAGVALQLGKVQASNHLSADDRYARHPKADAGRDYESMVSVPLWRAGEIDGVLNVIATRQDAFSAVDRTYITLLASVIDVARSRSVVEQHPEDAQD
jgi:GAF domain